MAQTVFLPEVMGSAVTSSAPALLFLRTGRKKKACPLKEPVKRASRCHVTAQSGDRRKHTLRLRSLNPPSSVSSVPDSLLPSRQEMTLICFYHASVQSRHSLSSLGDPPSQCHRSLKLATKGLFFPKGSPTPRSSPPCRGSLGMPRPRPCAWVAKPGARSKCVTMAPWWPRPRTPVSETPPPRGLSRLLLEVGLRRVFLEKKMGLDENPEAGRGRGLVGCCSRMLGHLTDRGQGTPRAEGL